MVWPNLHHNEIKQSFAKRHEQKYLIIDHNLGETMYDVSEIK